MESRVYKENYIVYPDGRVWSNKKNAWLKISTRGGYKQVNIGKVIWTIHRLIATLFIPNPNNLPIVMHLDNDKSNNSISNLKWGTYSDNNKHAFQSGKKTSGAFAMSLRGEACGNSKLTDNDVIEIRKRQFSITKLAKMYNVSNTTIKNIIYRKHWTHI